MLRLASTWLAICLLAAACTLGCIDEAPPPASPAPAPLPEFISGPTAPGMVWVGGCWHWDGEGYVWLPGHWDSPPKQARE
jgi:hypothetical protein